MYSVKETEKLNYMHLPYCVQLKEKKREFQNKRERDKRKLGIEREVGKRQPLDFQSGRTVDCYWTPESEVISQVVLEGPKALCPLPGYLMGPLGKEGQNLLTPCLFLPNILADPQRTSVPTSVLIVRISGLNYGPQSQNGFKLGGPRTQVIIMLTPPGCPLPSDNAAEVDHGWAWEIHKLLAFARALLFCTLHMHFSRKSQSTLGSSFHKGSIKTNK